MRFPTKNLSARVIKVNMRQNLCNRQTLTRAFCIRGASTYTINFKIES